MKLKRKPSNEGEEEDTHRHKNDFAKGVEDPCKPGHPVEAAY